MSDLRTLVLASNAGAYCYPWANGKRVSVMPPEAAFAQPEGFLEQFGKLILINGSRDEFLFHPRWSRTPKLDSYFFLWDPARCPLYAPGREELERLKALHKVYSFQKEDCKAFGLRFNSTMYAPPPPGLLPEPEQASIDLLFLGVPKDRLPLLRRLHTQTSAMGLRPCFRVGLTHLDTALPEQAEGWLVTREWLRYIDYLRMVKHSRCLLDLYQAIQTGYSLRVMEHIFFGKKLVTDNRVIKQAEFYHPNNIFLLQENKIDELKAWMDLPFVPVDETIKEYYTFEKWAERFE